MKPHLDNYEKRNMYRSVREYCGYLTSKAQFKERMYRNEAQKKYREKKLGEIVETYMKLYIDKQLNNGITIEQIAQQYITKEDVRASIIGKAELDIALQDHKAKKENKFLINPNKNNLNMSLQRYYNIVAVELCKKYIEEQDMGDR